MPFATFKRVYSVSSEDSIHCASNLLKSDPARKWKTSSSGEKSANIILELETPEIITGVDIGNEHSAFIEVLVGKNGWTHENFKELVLTSSFMTPIESKNSNNINRIRCFNQSDESWIRFNADEKWDLIKFICTQPFNKHVQYGLSLIKVHIAAQESKDLVPKKFLQQKHEITENSKDTNVEASSNKFIGKFKLRDDSDDDSDNNSTLFKRWKKQTTPNIENKQNTAASIRDASRSDQQPYVTKKLNINKNSESSSNQNGKDLKILDRNREALLYNKEDENSFEKFENLITFDKEQLEKDTRERDKLALQRKKDCEKPSNEQKRDFVPKTDIFTERNNSFSSKMKNLFEDDSTSDDLTPIDNSPNRNLDSNNSKDTSNSRKRCSEDSNFIHSKRKKHEKHYKPFNRLLENVILAISGIQNPDRADLRSKALELGAKYKPDWDSTCTHLICAFKNTPKYNQVKRCRGKIVKKSWIQKCYNLKKKLPWRRYALDSDEEAKSESDEEISDISSKPKKTNSPEPSSSKNSEKCIPTSTKYSYKNKNLDESDEEISDISLKPKQQNSPKSSKNSGKCIPIETKYLHKKKDLVESTQDLKNEADAPIIQSIEEKNNDISIITTKDIYDVTTDEDDFTKSKKTSENENKFFQNKKFFLEPKLSDVDRKKLVHMIEEFGGNICQVSDKANYIITNNRVYYLNLANFKGEIVKPLWIYECNDMECLIPTTRYT